jgi:hypothetical protein
MVAVELVAVKAMSRAGTEALARIAVIIFPSTAIDGETRWLDI